MIRNNTATCSAVTMFNTISKSMAWKALSEGVDTALSKLFLAVSVSYYTVVRLWSAVLGMVENNRLKAGAKMKVAKTF